MPARAALTLIIAGASVEWHCGELFPPKAQNAAQLGLRGLWKARKSLILVHASQVGEGIHHGLAEYKGKPGGT